MNSFYSKKILREFGLVFGFGFPILFGLIIWDVARKDSSKDLKDV